MDEGRRGTLLAALGGVLIAAHAVSASTIGIVGSSDTLPMFSTPFTSGNDFFQASVLPHGANRASIAAPVLQSGIPPMDVLLGGPADLERVETPSVPATEGLNERNADGETPLLAAIKKDLLLVGKTLLGHGADPNVPDRDGNTPLIEAVRWQRDVSAETTAELRKFLDLLIDSGADPNRENKDGETALIFATYIDNPSSFQLLLARGANPNQRTRDGRAVLLELTRSAENNRHAMIQSLLDARADVNIRDANDGATPLLNALHYRDERVAMKLIEHGADVNLADAAGTSPLHEAAERDSTSMVSALVERGARVDARDARGMTPLMKASSDDSARFLIEAKTDVNAADEDGMTALMYAAKAGREDVVATLIGAGANPNAADKRGQTAAKLAADSRRMKIVQLLSDAAANARRSDAARTDSVAASDGYFDYFTRASDRTK
jgi:ankyrin repeat protein